MVWGTDPDRYITEAEKICDAFTAETGIEVDYQSISWGSWYETFVTAVASNTNPDVSTGSGYQAFQFAELGYIEPVDDIYDEWNETGEIDEFMPRAVSLMYYDGHYRAIPWLLDVRSLVYNVDMLEDNGIEPPTNWDELYDACVVLAAAGEHGFALSGDAGGKQAVYQFCYNNGGGVMEEDGTVAVYSEENREAVAFLRSLHDIGAIYPAGAGMTGTELLGAFLNGDFAFMVASPIMLENHESDFEIGMLDPLVSPNGTYGGFFSANNIMLYSNSDCKPEAKQFLLYWTENQLSLFTQGTAAGLPARASFYEDAFYQDSMFLMDAYEKYIPIGGNAVWKMTTNFPEANELDGLTEWVDLGQGITLGADTDALLKIVDDAAKSVMGE
jgi:multiple sugar transport system substrate-binding protein